MRMRNVVAGVVLAGLVAGQPVASGAQEQSQGSEFGTVMGAAGVNLLWTPTKFITAGMGLVLGSVVGVLTGGDVRSAYAVWVPTAGGTYFVRPSHLDGTRPLDFFGSDYADRASTNSGVASASSTYDAAYFSR